MIRTIGKLACKTLGVGAILTAGFAYGVYSCILALGEENEKSQALLEKFKSIRKDYDFKKEEKAKKRNQELVDILNKLNKNTQEDEIKKDETQSTQDKVENKTKFNYEDWLTNHML